MWINNEISDDLLIKSNVPKKLNIARISFHIKWNLKGIVNLKLKLAHDLLPPQAILGVYDFLLSDECN